MKSGKHQSYKQRYQYLMLEGLRRCTIFCCEFMHYMHNYVTKKFRLVNSSVSSKQLSCFLQGKS